MRQLALVLVPALAMLVAPDTTLGWGGATHVHFTHRLGAAGGPVNLAEMYGSVLPDMFNLVLDGNGQFLADRMHHDVESVVRAAHGFRLAALAFGFASHSDSWAADFTAHHEGRSTPGTGYVIARGNQIAPLLIPDITSILVAGGLDPGTAGYLAAAIAPELGHDLAETGVDLMIKRNDDPQIGARLTSAAMLRPSLAPVLLSAAYARSLSQYAGMSIGHATRMLHAAEADYRQMMAEYGMALMLPEAEAIGALAGQSAAIAEMYLEAYAGVDVTVDPTLVAGFLVSAMSIVAPDYRAELDLSEAFVAQALESHGVVTGEHPFAKPGEELTDEGLATAYGLSPNYPNPFNPSTTLTFDLPSPVAVTLDVFNVIGQKVRTLLSAEAREAGRWQTVWDGRDDHGVVVPAGTYIARLSSSRGVSVRTMMLLK